jgi:hypothetical protein
MKLNNKGFAISGVLYPVFILFIALIFGIVGTLSSSKTLLDRIKNEIELELNGEDLNPTIVMVGESITLANGYSYALTNGISAYDYNGKQIGSERITYKSSPTFSTTVDGTYVITYTAIDSRGRSIDKERTIVIASPETYLFEYQNSGDLLPLTDSGEYKIELWGAEGGNSKYNSDGSGADVFGGKGAYVAGNVIVPKDTILGVFVGGKGANGVATVRALGGFNGGGLGSSAYQGGAGGGGATDVRIMTNNSYRYIRDYAGGSTINTGNHWVEIEAYDINNENVALNKTATCSAGGASLSVATDGLTATGSYASCTAGSNQWIEIDLGEEYELDRVVVRHYYGDARTYYETKTELYNSSRTVKNTIFDSAWRGTYAETSTGRINYYLDWNNFDDLKNRIIVAGGGAGASNFTNAVSGGVGGSLNGFNGILNTGSVAHTLATGGTQTAGGAAGGSAGFGTAGKFGIGGDSHSTHGSGAGAGYYGGGGSGYIASGVSSGAGGSSFISGLTNYNAIASTSTPASITHLGNPTHFSGLTFTNMSVIDGASSMPNPYNTGNITGNSGNGYAKITVLMKINY